MTPNTTVICAVWHRDPHRADLLAGHVRNLRAQTRPTERVYVFDGGDTPPAGLDGRVVVSPSPLTIYQAWNLAIRTVSTPLVMNLNLDDRLAPDAVEVLEAALAGSADLAGGDWRVCYTQSDTDAVTPCMPAEQLAFVPGWPPAPGTATRLGNGTGQSWTRGPACLWRMSLHREIGQYPERFGNGTPIRTIGDAIWWQLLSMHGKRMRIAPAIIGNYHSHPGEQAEFRNPAAAEKLLFEAHGVQRIPMLPIPVQPGRSG